MPVDELTPFSFLFISCVLISCVLISCVLISCVLSLRTCNIETPDTRHCDIYFKFLQPNNDLGLRRKQRCQPTLRLRHRLKTTTLPAVITTLHLRFPPHLPPICSSLPLLFSALSSSLSR